MHLGIHSKGLLAKRLRFAGLICWLLMATPSHAQVRSFSEGEEFSKDFTRHMQFVMTKQDAASWLTTWSTVHADSAWSIDQRLAFQAAARNILRKRILNAESWQALIDCMRYWADVTGEVTQAQGDRWFAQTVNQSKQLSRKGMEQYLHTAIGLTDLTKQGPIRLYDFNGLSWWLVDGEIALADADPEKPDDLLRYQIIHGSLQILRQGVVGRIQRINDRAVTLCKPQQAAMNDLVTQQVIWLFRVSICQCYFPIDKPPTQAIEIVQPNRSLLGQIRQSSCRMQILLHALAR